MREGADGFYDIVLIGAGPANLSVAAHLKPLANLSFVILEQRNAVEWHPGMLLQDSKLQSSHFKDLIFLSDPSSQFTMFSYLHSQDRLYNYIHVDFERPLRLEFQAYLKWVSQRLSEHFHYNSTVLHIRPISGGFAVDTKDRQYKARHVVLGIGKEPRVPVSCRADDDLNVFHSSEYVHRKEVLGGFHRKRIVVVGGGQSAAEIVRDLLLDKRGRPESIVWISRPLKLVPFDDTVPAADFYTPTFLDYFSRQSPSLKSKILSAYRDTSDGIVASIFRDIYQNLYVAHAFAEDSVDVKVRVGHTFHAAARTSDGNLLACSSGGQTEVQDECDVIALATGYETRNPLISGLQMLLNEDVHNAVNDDYSLKLDGAGGRIYVQNAALPYFGWADPNLGGVAVRSARIVNSIVGHEVYRNRDRGTLINWDVAS